MRKSGCLKVSLFVAITLVISSAIPGFAQAAQNKSPQTRTVPEFNSYNDCYKETDFAKKAELCEKFVDGFKDSDFVVNGYKLIIQSYYQTKNWQLLMDTADKAAALPAVDNSFKDYAYQAAMLAAQNTNNLDKCISYGDRVLALDPDNLTALVTVSTVIPQKSSTDIAQLSRAADFAHKALVIATSMLDKATPQEKGELVVLDGRLHGTLGLISYDEMDFKKSIQEYLTAIQDNKKDDASHFFMAQDYINLMVQASKSYLAAIEDEKTAIAAKADQPTMDDLKAKTAGHAEEVTKYRDTVIDELAVTVAINGDYTAQAKTELTKQWTAKNSSTTGLNDFVSQKKAQLGQ